jgi:hypothetical protein
MARRDATNRPRKRSWIVCAVLMVSLWRAPVPWIHSHETLEAQGLSEQALAWHVQHLHPQEAEHSIFGWHVHLSLPWEVSNEPSPLREPDAPKPRSVYEMPYVVSPATDTVDVDRHASHFAAGPMLDALPVMILLQADPSVILARHFTPAHSSRVSLRALICVARC